MSTNSSFQVRVFQISMLLLLESVLNATASNGTLAFGLVATKLGNPFRLGGPVFSVRTSLPVAVSNTAVAPPLPGPAITNRPSGVKASELLLNPYPYSTLLGLLPPSWISFPLPTSKSSLWLPSPSAAAPSIVPLGLNVTEPGVLPERSTFSTAPVSGLRRLTPNQVPSARTVPFALYDRPVPLEMVDNSRISLPVLALARRIPRVQAFSAISSVPGRNAAAGVGPLHKVGESTVGRDERSGDASSASRSANIVWAVACSLTARIARITDASGSTVSSFSLSTASACALDATCA